MYQRVSDRTAVCTNCIDQQLAFGQRGFGHGAERTAGARVMCDDDRDPRAGRSAMTQVSRCFD